MKNIYRMTRDELAAEVRELREKERVLHEEWKASHATMLDGIAQHRFMDSACRKARLEREAAVHRLEDVIRREAYDSVANDAALMA